MTVDGSQEFAIKLSWHYPALLTFPFARLMQIGVDATL